ncbi:bifunctional riboflavin kinase/FAD synthetase [Candidatus Bandiella euplotis]|uniref:Riboflavin biosynthesis protein n=1 Tax=Candidatus Bandiella euplotis TaxID=1664265 RepID=A0ABZ0UJW4_9RICK|nr:bifunctional riboflavin kinase/FAD synthetase [Candidatus Bandiella woodruffii]WPX96399.1 Riboflavin biosynthesis protein RibF [Candidatus Bandiella woodruffii]
MIICEGKLESFDIPKNLVLAIGNFDGIHIGHRDVINSCIEIAKRNGWLAAVLTFSPHPSNIIDPKNAKQPIYPAQQKIDLLKKLPLSHLFILDFDLDLMRLNHDEFIKKILIEKFQIKGVVTGYNFSFGNKKLGDVNTLMDASKKYGFLYHIVEKFLYMGIEVSSSKIRELLAMGLVETANQLLGENYAICGEVIRGKKMATTLGFKTANIPLKENYAYPLRGVYLVRVIINEIHFYGVANIGVKPTVSDENKILLEVHIFNFAKDIYGQILKVEFLHFIRPERKLKNIESLQKQVQNDMREAQYALRNIVS